MNAKYVVIIPYFSEEEVDRYLRIADWMRQLGPQRADYEFMLASSPKIQPSERLRAGFAQIAPAYHFACPTQIFGYPQGPTAMFWDCVDHLANDTVQSGGFGLWMESDMVPVKRDWLDQLVGQWESSGDPLVMGCYVPTVIKRRFVRRKRVWIHEHLNGGACYSKNFARDVPVEFREGTFDTVTWPFLKQSGRFCVTPSLSFSTVQGCRRDMADPSKAILHGFMQDKNAFVQQCTRPLSSDKQQFHELSDFALKLQHRLKSLKLRFFKRGLPAMMEALLMEQESLWRSGALTEIAAANVQPQDSHTQQFVANKAA